MRRHAKRVIAVALTTAGVWFLVVYLMVCGFAKAVE